MKTKSGFTLIEVLIVVMVISIIAALGIPSILRSRLTANESVARTSLKTISVACENYATANKGIYPEDEADLLQDTPPYLNKSYSGKTIQGYTYVFNLTQTGYSISASADNCRLSGSKDYTIVTGSLLTEADCND